VTVELALGPMRTAWTAPATTTKWPLRTTSFRAMGSVAVRAMRMALLLLAVVARLAASLLLSGRPLRAMLSGTIVAVLATLAVRTAIGLEAMRWPAPLLLDLLWSGLEPL